jgi:hypothetical protein
MNQFSIAIKDNMNQFYIINDKHNHHHQKKILNARLPNWAFSPIFISQLAFHFFTYKMVFPIFIDKTVYGNVILHFRLRNHLDHPQLLQYPIIFILAD